MTLTSPLIHTTIHPRPHSRRPPTQGAPARDRHASLAGRKLCPYLGDDTQRPRPCDRAVTVQCHLRNPAWR